MAENNVSFYTVSYNLHTSSSCSINHHYTFYTELTRAFMDRWVDYGLIRSHICLIYAVQVIWVRLSYTFHIILHTWCWHLQFWTGTFFLDSCVFYRFKLYTKDGLHSISSTTLDIFNILDRQRKGSRNMYIHRGGGGGWILKENEIKKLNFRIIHSGTRIIYIPKS